MKTAANIRNMLPDSQASVLTLLAKEACHQAATRRLGMDWAARVLHANTRDIATWEQCTDRIKRYWKD